MRKLSVGFFQLLVLGLVSGAADESIAGIVYVGVTNGDVYRYDNVAQMAQQTSTTITGVKVRDNAASIGDYSGDQAATADLSSGVVYRVTDSGSVVSYPTVADYVAGSNATDLTVGLNPYSAANNKRINGASYDGATGGFYAVGAGSNSLWPGDIAVFNSLAAFLAGTPDSVSTAGYNGNVLNFYDPDGTPGTTVGNANHPAHAIDAHYFQVAGNGRLEGFADLSEYADNAVNRINVTGTNAFGGANTLGFQAGTAFAVQVPEPVSLLLCLGGACSWAALRRR